MVLMYCLLLLITLFIFSYHFKKGVFRNINFYSVVWGVFVIYAIVPSILLSVNFFESYYFYSPLAGIEKEKDIIFLGNLLIIWSFLGILLTLFFLDLVFREGSVNFYSHNGFNKSSSFSHTSLILCLLVLIVSSVIYYYQSFPWYFYEKIRSSDALTLAYRRLELTQYYQGNGFVKTIAINFGYIGFFLAGNIISNRQKKYLLIFLFIVIGFFSISVTGEKAPIVKAFLFFYFGYNFFNKKYLNYKLVFILFVMAVLIFFTQFGFSLKSLDMFFERIFLAQSISVYLAVDQYYQNSPLIGFASQYSGLLKKLFEFNYTEPASVFYVDYYYPGLREVGTWNVNGVYIHEVLANFGIVWCVFAPVSLGIVFYVFLRLVSVKSKNNYLLLFYAYFVLSFDPLITSFNRLLFNTETILIAITLILLLFVGVFIKSYFNGLRNLQYGD